MLTVKTFNRNRDNEGTCAHDACKEGKEMWPFAQLRSCFAQFRDATRLVKLVLLVTSVSPQRHIRPSTVGLYPNFITVHYIPSFSVLILWRSGRIDSATY